MWVNTQILISSEIPTFPWSSNSLLEFQQPHDWYSHKVMITIIITIIIVVVVIASVKIVAMIIIIINHNYYLSYY